jgi:hypothetical protein
MKSFKEFLIEQEVNSSKLSRDPAFKALELTSDFAAFPRDISDSELLKNYAEGIEKVKDLPDYSSWYKDWVGTMNSKDLTPAQRLESLLSIARGHIDSEQMRLDYPMIDFDKSRFKPTRDIFYKDPEGFFKSITGIPSQPFNGLDPLQPIAPQGTQYKDIPHSSLAAAKSKVETTPRPPITRIHNKSIKPPPIDFMLWSPDDLGPSVSPSPKNLPQVWRDPSKLPNLIIGPNSETYFTPKNYFEPNIDQFTMNDPAEIAAGFKRAVPDASEAQVKTFVRKVTEKKPTTTFTPSDIPHASLEDAKSKVVPSFKQSSTTLQPVQPLEPGIKVDLKSMGLEAPKTPEVATSASKVASKAASLGLKGLNAFGSFADPAMAASSEALGGLAGGLGLGAEVASGLAITPFAVGALTSSAGEPWEQTLSSEERKYWDELKRKSNIADVQRIIDKPYNPRGRTPSERAGG